MKNKKLNQTLLILTIFVGFLAFGFSENVKGPAIVRIQDEFSLSEMQIGFMLSLNTLGYMIACSFTGFICIKIGSKKVNMAALFIMAFSGVLIFISKIYPSFLASIFIMCLGNGMLEIVLGILAAKAFTKNTALMMNISHFFYGFSSTIGPILSIKLIETTVSGQKLGWRGMYLIVLLFCLVPMAMQAFAKVKEEKSEDSELNNIKKFFTDPIAWIIVFLLSFAVSAEMSVGGWLANYMERAQSWSPESASMLLSAFFLAFTLSRLVIGHVIEKIGWVKSIIWLCLFFAVFSIVPVFAGGNSFVMFAAAGAGIAPVYPTVMAILAKRYKNIVSAAITFTVTVMGIINMCSQFVVGAAADVFTKNFNQIVGLKAAYITIGLFSVIAAVFAVILYKKLKQRNELL